MYPPVPAVATSVGMVDMTRGRCIFAEKAERILCRLWHNLNMPRVAHHHKRLCRVLGKSTAASPLTSLCVCLSGCACVCLRAYHWRPVPITGGVVYISNSLGNCPFCAINVAMSTCEHKSEFSKWTICGTCKVSKPRPEWRIKAAPSSHE